MPLFSRAVSVSISMCLCAALAACGGDEGGDPGGGQGTEEGGAGGSGGRATPPSGPQAVAVHLVPRDGVSGPQRVNFAVPLAPGALSEAGDARVLQGGEELPSARRGLARYADGSLRSLQVQVDVDVAGEADLEVRLGEAAGAGDLALAPVEETLDPPDGTGGPRVWALLPAGWLSASGVVGPSVPEADVEGTPLAAWGDQCDYEGNDVEAFLGQSGDGAVWLYDRGTVMYRGHARRGDLGTLESAYRETAIYRAAMTGAGDAVDNGVPGKAGDLKYDYTQNMAIHYLLSGDDRFRESAEQMAVSMGQLWTPEYGGDGGSWTERHAGFLLLAHVWAARVSDDRADELAALADKDVAAYLDIQAGYPPGYDSASARCFAHTAEAHSEDFGTWGCSPWMSAILADGLDAYATDRGDAEASAVREAIVKLGRVIAERGRDADGRPYYWMTLGEGAGEVDDFEEHWGESAYIVAMAWAHAGKRDAALLQAANELLNGFATRGVVPHMRSFNWQCRSAVAAPYYLR